MMICDWIHYVSSHTVRTRDTDATNYRVRERNMNVTDTAVTFVWRQNPYCCCWWCMGCNLLCLSGKQWRKRELAHEWNIYRLMVQLIFFNPLLFYWAVVVWPRLILQLESHCLDNSTVPVRHTRKLRRKITKDNSMDQEIKDRTVQGSRCYYAPQSVMSSKNVKREIRIRIYLTTILPVVQ